MKNIIELSNMLEEKLINKRFSLEELNSYIESLSNENERLLLESNDIMELFEIESSGYFSCKVKDSDWYIIMKICIDNDKIKIFDCFPSKNYKEKCRGDISKDEQEYLLSQSQIYDEKDVDNKNGVLVDFLLFSMFTNYDNKLEELVIDECDSLYIPDDNDLLFF